MINISDNTKENKQIINTNQENIGLQDDIENSMSKLISLTKGAKAQLTNTDNTSN